MRRGWLALVLLAGSPPAAPAATLESVLARTYATSPDLQAARAALAASDEAVAQALAAKRPTASALASLGPYHDTQIIYGPPLPAQSFAYHQRTAQINLAQPVYHGGALDAGVARAEAQVLAQRAQLQATEAALLLRAATAYADVILQRQLVGVAQAYEADLQQLARMVGSQFGHQDITRTALDRTLGRLAGATVQRLQAEAGLRDAADRFRAVVGDAPDADLTAPSLPQGLPGSAEAAAAAERDTPAVQGATQTARAADAAVQQAEAALRPSVDLAGLAQLAEQAVAGTPVANQLNLVASVTVPIYQGGQLSSAVRAARGSRDAARSNIEAAQRSAVRDAGDAWASYASAGEELSLRRRQVSNDRTAYAAMLHLSLQGQRTIVDSLDTRLELAQVSAAAFQAAHDQLVAAYLLLQATGALDARHLALKVTVFDPAHRLQQIRGVVLDPPFQR